MRFRRALDRGNVTEALSASGSRTLWAGRERHSADSVGKQTIMSVTLSRFIGSAAHLRLALLAAALLGGCGGGSSDKTYEGDGYTLRYPGGWEERAGSGAPGVGNEVSSVAFAPEAGANGLTLTVYRLPTAITEDNIGSYAGDVRSVTAQIFRAGGGRMIEGPTRVTFAAHPAFTATGTGVTPSGTQVRSWVNLVFDGTMEYFFNCQFTADQTERCSRAAPRFWSHSRSATARASIN